MWNGKHGRSVVLERKCLEVIFEGVQTEFLSEEEEEGIKAEKAQEPSVQSLV